MKHIILLEKHEQGSLKGGQVLTFNLPDGQSIQIGFDGVKTKKEKNGEVSEGRTVITKVDRLKEYFTANPKKWMLASEIKDKVIGDWSCSSIILLLEKRGFITKKEIGLSKAGHVKYAYRLKKGAR